MLFIEKPLGLFLHIYHTLLKEVCHLLFQTEHLSEELSSPF